MSDPFPVGELAAVATASCWASSSLAFTQAARLRGATVLNVFRLLVAAAVLALVVTVSGEWDAPPTRQLWALVASGVLGLALGDLALFEAFRILGARRSMLLMSLAPLVTTGLSVPLLAEPLGGLTAVAIVVTLVGVAWVQLERDSHGEVEGSMALGVGLGALAAVGQGSGLVFAKLGLGLVAADAPLSALLDGEPAVEVSALLGTFVRMATGVAIVVPVAYLTGWGRGLRNAARDVAFLRPALIGVALGPVAGVWLSMVAVGRADAAVAATIIATAPALVIPLAFLTTGARVSARGLLGTLLALAGVALLFLAG